MKAKDFKDFFNSVEDRDLDNEVSVVVVNQGSIGATPTVTIRNIQHGFDWDNNRILVFTDNPVAKLSAEDLDAVRKSIGQAQSYHTLKVVKPVMDENKALKSILKDLGDELFSPEQLKKLRELGVK